MKIAFGLAQNAVGLFQKSVHKLSRDRHRYVDDNHELINLLHFPEFLRLDQWHVSVMTQPEGVQDIIEGIRIDVHFLAQRRKLPEKGAVVIFFPVLHFCLLEEIAVFLGHLCGEGFHLRLRLL